MCGFYRLPGESTLEEDKEEKKDKKKKKPEGEEGEDGVSNVTHISTLYMQVIFACVFVICRIFF